MTFWNSFSDLQNGDVGILNGYSLPRCYYSCNGQDAWRAHSGCQQCRIFASATGGSVNGQDTPRQAQWRVRGLSYRYEYASIIHTSPALWFNDHIQSFTPNTNSNILPSLDGMTNGSRPWRRSSRTNSNACIRTIPSLNCLLAFLRRYVSILIFCLHIHCLTDLPVFYIFRQRGFVPWREQLGRWGGRIWKWARSLPRVEPCEKGWWSLQMVVR